MPETQVGIVYKARNEARAASQEAAADLKRLASESKAAFEETRRASRVSFAGIQEGVRTARADFKAGIIGVHDYRTALQVAREQAVSLRQASSVGGKALSTFGAIM